MPVASVEFSQSLAADQDFTYRRLDQSVGYDDARDHQQHDGRKQVPGVGSYRLHDGACSGLKYQLPVRMRNTDMYQDLVGAVFIRHSMYLVFNSIEQLPAQRFVGDRQLRIGYRRVEPE